MADCGFIVDQDDKYVELDSYHVSDGTEVNVACRLFANRLVEGAAKMVCENGTWNPNTTPKCEYNGEFNSYEIIVISVSAAAAALLVFMLIIITACGLRFRHKLREQKKKKEDDAGSTSTVSLHKRNGAIHDQGYRLNTTSGAYQQQIQYSDSRGPYTKKPDGYVYYTGKSSEDQYFDNKAYEPSLSPGGSHDFADPVKHGSRPFSYIKEEKYKWEGHLPRPALNREHY